MGAVRTLVVGGSPEPAFPAFVSELAAACDVVCAVDHGYDVLHAADVAPQLFCGDCDSLSSEGLASLQKLLDAGACEVERYNPEKDYTDLSLALRAVSERWRGADVVATCVTGGRPDHFLAVMGCLAGYRGGGVSVEEMGYSARILHGPSEWELCGAAGRTFSFIPLSAEVEVSEVGMQWELDHRRCPLLTDLGVSNVLTSDSAHFTCHRGVAVAYCLRSRSC